MKHIKPQLLYIFTGLILLGAGISCKKEKEESNEPTESSNVTTTVKLLTMGPWVSADFKRDGLSLLSFLPECLKDNIQELHEDRSALTIDGPMKCNPSDPDTALFKWTLIKNDSMILLEPGLLNDAVDSMTIVTLTESQIVLILENDETIDSNAPNELWFERK